MINEQDSLEQEVENLHRLTVYGRWLFVFFCWLVFGSASIWSLREEIFLLRQHFTWAAVRYGLSYNLLGAFGLTFCVGIMASVLVWQSQNILRGGISDREKYLLEQKVKRIRKKGVTHPLWKFVCLDEKS